jgi:class 3 adenylate cyclase
MNSPLPSPHPGPLPKGEGETALPTGTVTFLFTDIQGSTPLWERQPEQMAINLQVHNAALRQTIEAHGGVVFKTVGDAFQAAISTAPEGLRAVIEGQHALQAAPWNELGPLKVRMGLHTGAHVRVVRHCQPVDVPNVDGYKWPPDLHGTGTEDYFGQA